MSGFSSLAAAGSMGGGVPGGGMSGAAPASTMPSSVGMGSTGQEQLILKGFLKGHTDWVTQIVTNPQYPDTLFSSSRDRSLICWQLTRDDGSGGAGVFGVPRKRLTGHNNFISDMAISSDGQFALTSSWDRVLRLWDLNASKTTKKFLGHTDDVLSVAFSSDNRQIVSGAMDKTIKLWNTLGICKYTIQEENHNEWVSCVRFSPSTSTPLIVSAGWDNVVKVWNLTNCKLRTNHYGHTKYLNTVTVSPDGSLCASGGRDGQGMLWDLNEGRHLYTFPNTQPINALTFSPNRYWLCAACGPSIKIWDLETKAQIEDLRPNAVLGNAADVTCLTWSADGNTLFAGYTDWNIKVYQIAQAGHAGGYGS